MERVASVHMKETLIRIMEATKEHPGPKCFIAGHSMGGMIIGKSIAPVLTTLLLTDQSDGARMPVDLDLLQNPALEALASWQTIDLLKRLEVSLELRSRDGSVRRADGPLIAAITSEADFATRVAYPFGRNIANLGMSFRDADADAADRRRDARPNAASPRPPRRRRRSTGELWQVRSPFRTAPHDRLGSPVVVGSLV